MYVCLCHGVTNKTIKQAVIENGVGSMRELRALMNIGDQCGRCVQMTQEIVDSTIIDESLFREVS